MIQILIILFFNRKKRCAFECGILGILLPAAVRPVFEIQMVDVMRDLLVYGGCAMCASPVVVSVHGPSGPVATNSGVE